MWPKPRSRSIVEKEDKLLVWSADKLRAWRTWQDALGAFAQLSERFVDNSLQSACYSPLREIEDEMRCKELEVLSLRDDLWLAA